MPWFENQLKSTSANQTPNRKWYRPVCTHRHIHFCGNSPVHGAGQRIVLQIGKSSAVVTNTTKEHRIRAGNLAHQNRAGNLVAPNRGQRWQQQITVHLEWNQLVMVKIAQAPASLSIALCCQVEYRTIMCNQHSPNTAPN
jgi:hypothetical protein